MLDVQPSPGKPGKLGRGQASRIGAARARFSVLARLVHGRDIATAARCAGFASGRAALESFQSGKVWARLAAAIGRRVSHRDLRLVAVKRRAASAAGAAMRRQRALSARLANGAARSVVHPSAARRVQLTSGAAL